jgi:parallel beta-helix repeat protein
MRNSLLATVAVVLLFSCKKEINEVKTSTGNLSSATASGQRIYFNSPNNYVDENFNYSPGDTFVLTSGVDYTYFTMSNLHDVTIINEGGVVHLQNGFNLTGCKNVTITGTGSNDRYGFEISGHTPGDVGVDINGKSAHIICSNIYVHDKTYGFWVKQEVGATCDESLYYPNWYLDSIEISNCMIKAVDQEGMYLGSTGQNADRPNSCGQLPYPMRLSNISVHDNIVDSTGRGGIMLSGADRGVNRIYSNVISRCGYEYNSYQGNGIVIGGNAYANIDSNTIKNTLCDGIWVLGSGITRVRYNTIDSSGWLNGVYAGNMHGISFDARPSYPFDLLTFRIRYNTIGDHTDKADIYIYNSPVTVNGQSISGFDTQRNLIYDNNNGNAVVTAQDGIQYSTTPVNP